MGRPALDPSSTTPIKRTPPGVRGPRGSSDVAAPGTFETLKAKLIELQSLTNDLRHAFSSNARPDYEALATNSTRVLRLAKCMQSETGLAQPASGESTAPLPTKQVFGGDLPQLITALEKSVNEFANNPVTHQPKILDAQLIGEAALVLERIIFLGTELSSRAEALSRNLGPGERIKSSARAKTNYKRPAFLQLTLNCGIWNPSVFSRQPAAVEKDGTVMIEGLKVQVNHHKLATRQLISLEDCMPCSFDEKAFAEGETYAALLKDFYSYEINGRRFAYGVAFEVVRIKQDKIKTQLFQPVVRMFIDPDGQGEFELAENNNPLSQLPLWVKGIGPHRWAVAAKPD